MATKRIKDLTNTAASVASDAYLAIDGTSNGTEKITRDNFRQDTADAFVAAPGTYNLAPLSGGAVEVAKGGTGSTTAAGARTNLSVNSIDEDAQANGTKVTAPSMYFNGSSSVVTVADDDKLTFSSLTEFGKTTAGTWSPEDNTPALTDGTGTLNDHYKIDADGTVAQGGSTLSIIDGASVTAGQVVYYDGSVWRVKDCDDLPFTVSAFIKMTDATLFSIVGKYTGTSSEREWLFWVNGSDKLNFFVQDNASGNSEGQESTAALTSYEGQWIHVAASYGGSGSSSASSYSAASDEITIFVNGEAVAMTDVSGGTYTGMANGGGAMWVGRASSSYAKGSIRDVKIFNRELTSTEIAQLARGNDLGFADEWAGTNGGQYTSDFSSTTDSFTTSATAVAQISGTIDGRSNLLRIAGDGTTANHAAIRNVSATVGKRYRIVIDYNIQASNTVVDGIKVRWNNGSVYSSLGTSAGAWGRLEFEEVATDTDLEIYLFEGASQTNAAPGTDYVYISSVTVTEIGTLADFRAEDYNESASKLLDRSSNNFVGVGTSVTLTGNQRHISADTIDLKNLPTSSAGLSAGEVWSNSGVLTVV